MHDPADDARQPHPDWSRAFARLPPERPPAGGWQRLAASLPPVQRTPRPLVRRRMIGGLALAATLALAVALPWRGGVGTRNDGTVDRLPSAGAAAATTHPAPSTASLQAESARLETLLAHAGDGRVASGSAAAISADLEGRVAAIDAALADPALGAGRELALWQARVEALQALASFEGTRRWLAANGEHYDAALVQVN